MILYDNKERGNLNQKKQRKKLKDQGVTERKEIQKKKQGQFL